MAKQTNQKLMPTLAKQDNGKLKVIGQEKLPVPRHEVYKKMDGSYGFRTVLHGDNIAGHSYNDKGGARKGLAALRRAVRNDCPTYYVETGKSSVLIKVK